MLAVALAAASFRVQAYVAEQEIPTPETFISYAWGVPQPERWVEKWLATDLQKAGIAVLPCRGRPARIASWPGDEVKPVSDTWPLLSTCVPEGHNFEEPSARAVVDEVLGSRQIQATRFRAPGVLDPCPDSGLFDQGAERRLKIDSYRSRRRGPVLAPPSGGGFDLPLRSKLDTKDQRQV